MRKQQFVLSSVCFLLAAHAFALPQSLDERAHSIERYEASHYSKYNPQTLFDILSRLPGITIGQQSDGREEIQLHGLDSRYVLLLINNRPLAGNSLNDDLSTKKIPANIIERIEIDRNARSDAYLGGGSSGTINVILRNAESAKQLQITLGTPEFNHRETAAIGWKTDERAVRLQVESAQSENIEHGKSQTPTIKDTFHQHQTSSDQSVLLSYENLLNDHQIQFYFLYLKSHEETHLNGLRIINTIDTKEISNDYIDHRYENNRIHTRISGDIKREIQDLTLNVFFLLERFNQFQEYDLILPSILSQEQKTRDKRWQVGANLKQNLDEHRWQIGFSIQNLNRLSETDTDYILSINNERTTLPFDFNHNEYRTNFFVLDRWQISPVTYFEAGFHVDSYWAKHSYTSRSSYHSYSTDTYWLPAFHIMHQVSSQARLRLSASQSIRLPNMTDTVPYQFTQDDRVWQGNKNLNPELMSSFDLGYEQNFRLRNSSITNKNSGFYVRAYKRIIRDPIYLDSSQETINGQAVTIFKPMNSSEFGHSLGIEIDLALGLWEGSLLDIGTGYYHSRLNTDLPLPDQKRIPSQPNYIVRLGLNQELNHWNFGFLWRQQGETFQYFPTDNGYWLQTRSSLQQLDLFMGYKTANWHNNLLVSMTPNPSAKWHQIDQQQWLDRSWLISISSSFRFY